MKGSEMVELLLLEYIISDYQNEEFKELYDKLYDMDKLIYRYRELTTQFMAPYVKDSDSQE